MIKEIKILKELESFTGNGSQKLRSDLLIKSMNKRMEYILNICFNPFATTKLHKLILIEPSKELINDDKLFDDFYFLIEDLIKAPAANDILRGRAQKLLSYKLSEDLKEDNELRDMLMKILTKNMNIGIGAKLINKALKKELIPDLSVMLASDTKGVIEKWKKIYCEEKYDGVRIIAVYKNNNIQYYTRAFNEIDNSYFNEITKSLLKCIKAAGMIDSEAFFDGELTDLDRKSVSGKVTKMIRGTAEKNIDKGILYNVFDFDSLETLNNGVGVALYTSRRTTLENLFKYIDLDSPVKISQMWELNSADDVTEIYQKIVNLGGEGVICKEDVVYETKRSKSWIKIKEVNECDLVITGWYQGEGKRTGYIGGFMMTDKSKTLNVKVGSGFTDNDLKELSKNPDELIGKIASVLYNVTIVDKFNNRSLFLPRFVTLRNDKTEPDNMSNKF